MTAYDDQNVFAKILRGEIPCTRVYEDKYVLAFEDTNPQAPVHVLIIPKGEYVSMTDFTELATDAEIVALNRAILNVADIKGLKGSGYRILANSGADSHQEVPHLHVHVFGGRVLGPLLSE